MIMILRLIAALAAPLLVVTSRWHTELIYPIERSFAAQISSGFVTLEGAAAVRFDHLLWYLAIVTVAALAIDYIRLMVEVRA